MIIFTLLYLMDYEVKVVTPPRTDSYTVVCHEPESSVKKPQEKPQVIAPSTVPPRIMDDCPT
jgi:hypothetical protein